MEHVKIPYFDNSASGVIKSWLGQVGSGRVSILLVIGGSGSGVTGVGVTRGSN